MGPAPTFDSLTLADLGRRRSEKWRKFPADVLPAFVAEMDFSLAPPIAASIIEAVRNGDSGYAWPTQELGEALSHFARTRFAWDIDPNDVTLIPDVMVGVTEVLRVATRPGDAVVINTPVYPPFFRQVHEAGCRVAEVPLIREAQRYRLDLAGLERAFASGARAYLLCNPHNPTGSVLTLAELREVAKLAARHEVVVLSDEIHAPLVLPGARHIPFLSLGEPAARLGIAFVSASKAWNIPGLKCAQLVASSSEMRAVAGRLPEGMQFRAGILGIIATVEAYKNGTGWLDDLLVVLDRNRKLVGELLAEQMPEVRYLPPEGGYLAWLDCRGLRLDEEPADFFLAHGRLALGPGRSFGEMGSGYARLTMATTEAILREIVQRMRLAAETLTKPSTDIADLAHDPGC